MSLLVHSASQSVVAELSLAFQCQQLAFKQEFAFELLHFSLLPSHSGLLPFVDFSVLLEEIVLFAQEGKDGTGLALREAQRRQIVEARVAREKRKAVVEKVKDPVSKI